MSLDMRGQFVETTTRLMRADARLALVLAEIGVAQFAQSGAPAARVFNVGIREQLMVGVASGLATTGFRPIIHSIATFAVERPYEQLKIDLGHQDVGAVVVGYGASYDYSSSGRTHHAPEDVALIASLPGWDVHVPGHPLEVEAILTQVAAEDGRAYVRLSAQENSAAHAQGPVRLGGRGTVIAVGPMLDRVLAATADLDVTVLYASTVRPFDAGALRASMSRPDIVLVEPYQEGTSSAEVTAALADVPHRLLAIGVRKVEYRGYGTMDDHDRAHGLDERALRARIGAFLR
jgi:transketolase